MERECPACSGRMRRAFEKDGREYSVCAGCGGAFAEVPAGEPARYHDYLPELTKVLPEATRNRYAELLGRLERFRTGGRILDIGCGAGWFVGVAGEMGWKAEGTEVSGAAVDFARGRGLDVRRGILSDFAFVPGTYDVVTLFEVIEHVARPGDLLAQCAGLVRPGGALYLTTPNYGSLTRRLLGREWSVISRDHVSLLTPRGLAAVAERAGLAPIRLTSRNILPHEVLKVFHRRGSAGNGEGTGMRRTAALQGRIESRPILRALKGVANLALGVTGTGDTLVLLARRRGVS